MLSCTTLPTASDAVVSDSKNELDATAVESERTHDAQLIVWAVLADGIGNRKPFVRFLPMRHATRSVA